MSNDDYAVGRGRPPLHTRFQKGQRANPKGRPKGSPNLTTIIARAAREKVTVVVNGRRKMITKLEAAMTQLANQAAAGDQRAIQILIAQIAVVERVAAQTPGAEPTDRKAADAALLSNLRSRLVVSAKDEADDNSN